MKILSKISILAALLLTLTFAACQKPNPNWKADANSASYLHRSLKRITDVIVHDIFSPPVASRIYTYSNVAAYEAMVPGFPEYAPLAGQLRGLTPAPQPEAGKEYCFPLAGAIAMLKVGKTLIFSEDTLAQFRVKMLEEFKAIRMPADVFERSVDYGEAVADHIIKWSGGDNYKQTRTFPKYTITDETDKWKPTPPDYMDAIEPHWNKIRPFTLDSAAQFAPPTPTAFDMKNKNSPFYKGVMEVYEALKTDSNEMKNRIAIAQFWDCNPYVSHHKGHVVYATKKITPGGHWMGIAQIACKKANADIMKSSEAYVFTALSLVDGFISCWDEKYRSQVIRPETVINAYVDQGWMPLLQTPPFPEYTSGHSVISTSAATVLTSVFGDNFAYTDSVEVEFGMPPRSFISFMQAAQEAAISRLYGGIHYSPACDFGKQQGAKVGAHVLAKVKSRK